MRTIRDIYCMQCAIEIENERVFFIVLYFLAINITSLTEFFLNWSRCTSAFVLLAVNQCCLSNRTKVATFPGETTVAM